MKSELGDREGQGPTPWQRCFLTFVAIQQTSTEAASGSVLLETQRQVARSYLSGVSSL